MYVCLKYAAIAFALIAAVSAVDPIYNSYSSYGSYGVNQPLNQYAVPALSHNAAAIHGYASPIAQKFVSPVQSYGVAQKVVAPFGHGYAAHDASVERDFGLEAVQGGSRYAIQGGPFQLQQHFTLGHAGHGVHEKIVAPEVYGGYGHAKIVAPQVYGGYGYGASKIVAPQVYGGYGYGAGIGNAYAKQIRY